MANSWQSSTKKQLKICTKIPFISSVLVLVVVSCIFSCFVLTIIQLIILKLFSLLSGPCVRFDDLSVFTEKLGQ